MIDEHATVHCVSQNLQRKHRININIQLHVKQRTENSIIVLQKMVHRYVAT